MQTNIVGYEEFESWERDLARTKAASLVGKDGLTRSDFDDLQAEFLLAIYLTKRKYDPDHPSGASLETFLSRVLDRQAKKILRFRRGDKRSIHLKTESFETRIEKKDGSSITHAERLIEEDAPWFSGRPYSQRLETQLLVRELLDAMSDSDREICELLKQGFSVSDITAIVNKSWSTVKDQVLRIRKSLPESELVDFV